MNQFTTSTIMLAIITVPVAACSYLLHKMVKKNEDKSRG